jgi:hypothetical protein
MVCQRELLFQPPDENSKFKVQFLLNMYYFDTIIKKKNPKLLQGELGTLSISFHFVSPDPFSLHFLPAFF